MKKISLTILAGGLLVLGGCANDADYWSGGLHKEVGKPLPGFGNAVKNNIAAQVVNPDAPNDADVKHVGDRLAKGQGRYVADKVEKPKTVGTSEISSGGGGGDKGGQ
jgi:hypothetical protein